MKRARFALPLLLSLPFHVLAAEAVPASAAPAATKATAPESAAAEAKPAAPLATVNGVAIPAIYGEFVRQNRMARNLPPDMLSAEAIRDTLIAAELLVQDAQKKGLDKEPSVAAALEFQKRELLGKAALEEYARTHPISDELLKAEYDKTRAKAGDQEYHARHILVKTEKEAKDVLAQLKKPKAKFEALAKKYSKDSSAGNGGDLGWTLPANLVPEFAQVMTTLKKGEVAATPVQTQFGWHIIRLDETRALDFPSFDKLKGRIANQMQQQAVRRYVQEMKATARIE